MNLLLAILTLTNATRGWHNRCANVPTRRLLTCRSLRADIPAIFLMGVMMIALMPSYTVYPFKNIRCSNKDEPEPPPTREKITRWFLRMGGFVFLWIYPLAQVCTGFLSLSGTQFCQRGQDGVWRGWIRRGGARQSWFGCAMSM